jgi:hypothetical protein
MMSMVESMLYAVLRAEESVLPFSFFWPRHPLWLAEQSPLQRQFHSRLVVASHRSDYHAIDDTDL